MAEEQEPGLLGRIGRLLRRPGRESDSPVQQPGSSGPRPSRGATSSISALIEAPRFDRADHPLMHGHPPAWASGWGEDRFGVFVDLTIAEVTQRMRWIGPGTFMMGSPEDEPGRWSEEDTKRNKVDLSEGPQHEVTLSSGFWLFDTPVTQALWAAVSDENPSYFKSPERPVEHVSWHDAQAFLERINALVPGLDLVLPTEAQWEYACRAGTGTATYAGPIEILGENNAPVLDPIAWYGGNSGVGFELDHGHDASDWPNKQYDFDQAGSRPVAQKVPNAWGLHDMLGNVWEWCADELGPYGEGPETDPAGPQGGSGARRVLRGGSWYNYARGVRAAYRDAYSPDDRSSNFGFRCARGRP